jgi:hypothetical protein
MDAIRRFCGVPEAFVARGVWIMSDGSLVVVDLQRPTVCHTSTL